MPSCNTYSLTWVSLTLDVGCCSSKAQPLLLTLDEVAHPDLEHGVAPLGPPKTLQPPLLGSGVTPVQVLISYLFYILWCVYVNLNVSIYSPLLLLTLW